MSPTPFRNPTNPASTDVFARVLVGVESTAATLPAAWQARVLAGDDGVVVAVVVADVAAASQAGAAAVHAATLIRDDAERVLGEVVALSSPDTSAVVAGRPAGTLLAQVAVMNATVLALGASPHRRMTGLLLGEAGSLLLRHSPCSVLVARDCQVESWPRRILAGVDGSPPSLRGVQVATDLARRHRAELTLITGLGGKPLDVDRVRELCPQAKIDPRAPVDALVQEARAGDLVVVASRGLHGLEALGSVSERVARRAGTSVLVLR
jgi:nucleotide-binding universal stress UspA family protein